jgi:hypothetical protein
MPSQFTPKSIALVGLLLALGGVATASNGLGDEKLTPEQAGVQNKHSPYEQAEGAAAVLETPNPMTHHVLGCDFASTRLGDGHPAYKNCPE